MNFTKMHGLGNDFILIDCREQAFSVQHSAFSDLSKRLCHRRFGIGADQLLLLYPSNIADFKMRIFNADGCEVEMCGNGIRCLAKYIWDRNLSDKNILHIETLAGIIRAEKVGDMVKVDMGKPIFEPEKIPVNISQESLVNSQQSNPPSPPFTKGGHEGINDQCPMTNDQLANSSPIVDYPLQVKDREFLITCVSMGNPHAIIVVNNISDFPVTYYGPMIENHPIFPKRTNVEFIKILNPSEITMRVWERGSGETMACGTGASAAAVASNIKGLTGKNVTVHLLGGDLFIEWSDENYVYMTGPATEVFEGTIES
ncbi:MAG: diaminopimelate epimerase [Nitrospirota bacterium]